MSFKHKPWPEWLFWIGALILVFSMVVPGAWQIRIRRRHAMTRADLRAIVRATENFFNEYGYPPTALRNVPGGVRFGDVRPNAEVLNPLRAVDGPGNENHRVNPNRLVFLRVPAVEPGRSGVNEQGEFLDPWGQPYQIVLDTDLEYIVRFPRSIYRPLDETSVAAWSYGPDRKPDSPDDILSWEQP